MKPREMRQLSLREQGPLGQDSCSPAQSMDDVHASATSGSSKAETPNSRDDTPDNTTGFDYVLHEMQELQENASYLQQCFANLKAHHQQEYTGVEEALQEELYRYEHLEELSDLKELHQNEILNLKEELAGMEEKTAYQCFERATDIHGALEACQRRLFKLEQQQQVAQLEGLENGTARTLLGKLINVLLAVMAVILAFVSIVGNCVAPLVKTCSRTLLTLFLAILLAFLWRHWGTTSENLHSFFCT